MQRYTAAAAWHIIQHKQADSETIQLDTVQENVAPTLLSQWHHNKFGFLAIAQPAIHGGFLGLNTAGCLLTPSYCADNAFLPEWQQGPPIDG